MRGWKRVDGTFSDAQRKRMADLFREGKTPKQVAKIAGCSVRYVYIVLKAQGVPASNKIRVEEAPERKEAGFFAEKATADSVKHVERENDYLRWVARGAINGWVDRLIQDIKDGKLT